MPRYASEFYFSGALDRISIRVQLFQKGIQSLDFDRFNQESFNDRPTKNRLDDVTFTWRQKVGRPENSNRRIFTLNEDDEFPEHLKAFQPEKPKENEEGVKEVEHPTDDYVVYRKSNSSRVAVKRSYLFIFAKLGAMDFEDTSAVELIARITATTSSNRLVVEPAFLGEDIEMETKYGDYSARIKIEDRELQLDEEEVHFDGRASTRKMRPSITSLPESDHFVAARDGLVESVVNVCLEKASHLLFDEGLTIDYKLRLPRGIRLKTKNRTGRSQRYSADDTGIVNFGLVLEFVFESPANTDSFPLLLLRIMAVDYWGRQYIAGYGSAYISLDPGTTSTRVHLWRPISHNSLYEMFVGQAIDVDYFGTRKSPMEKTGIDGQPSGVVRLKSVCVAQSRQYMARDVLYQLKYGSKMANMGLRSDFYQRIIKVLMEFEEARSKLILARTLNKQKIRQ